MRSHNIVYVPLQHVWQLHLPPHEQNISLGCDIECAQDMSLSVTPHGVLAYIPVITYQNMTFVDLFWCSEEKLAWPADHARPASRLLLRLTKDPDTLAGPESSRRKSYIVDASRLLWIEPPKKSLRYVIAGRQARGSWQMVLIRHRPPPHRLPGQLLLADPRNPFIPAVPAQLVVDTPFRFDEVHIQKFGRQFGASSMTIWDSPTMTTYAFAFERSWSPTWNIVIRVGRKCPHASKLHQFLRPPALNTVWATVTVLVSAGRILRSSSWSEGAAEPPQAGDQTTSQVGSLCMGNPPERTPPRTDFPHPNPNMSWALSPILGCPLPSGWAPSSPCRCPLPSHPPLPLPPCPLRCGTALSCINSALRRPSANI